MNCKSLFIIVIATPILSLLTSCSTCSRVGDAFFIPDELFPDTIAMKRNTDEMSNMVDNISSPIEMASLMKALNVPFSQQYLADCKNVSNYITSYEKAFNLGIFGCDLGYLNMYGRTSIVVNYIAAIRTLADGINVGQFFDFSTLKRLATSNQNVDSLVYISQQSFNKMDKYLQRNNRANLSVLMVSGVWLEGLYLSAQFLKEKPREKRLAESIGEQKVILEQLLEILEEYKQERFIEKVCMELSTIKEVYDEIKISYIAGEPKTIEVDGFLTVIQTETSVVEYTDEQMQEIVRRAEIVRNKLIQ